MNSIGIIVNLEKPDISQLTDHIVSWLKNNGKDVYVTVAEPNKANIELVNATKNNIAEKCDCVIVLGGDGTLLHCARAVASKGIPLFGVNLGQLGFLTEIEVIDITPALEKLISGQFNIEQRMMIQATVMRNGKEIDNFYGLNDAVITKGAFARIIRLKTYVNNEYVDIYPADGMIISTPTGSTAYSLSAGGPLVVPNLKVMIVTPICPHTLSSRPMVIDCESVVKVELQSTQAEVMLTIDGQSGLSLEPFDEIIVRRAPFDAKFIKLSQRGFYEILRKKLKEGRNIDV